ncbi:AlpA family transcriptional regulator [Pseudomonas sp.]|uniref:helix-turn-helix transcriptional regulator n=1 Tax=Pseudomonas sp. TaxID=306 RepID=UPI002D1FB5BB|nr:AlpA family transcriptional regulator [Pseudomonas sp.]
MEIHRMATHTATLLRLPTVCAQIGLSKSQIYRLIRAGEFPPPVRLGQNSVAWPADQVDSWIHEKISAARWG